MAEEGRDFPEVFGETRCRGRTRWKRRVCGEEGVRLRFTSELAEGKKMVTCLGGNEVLRNEEDAVRRSSVFSQLQVKRNAVSVRIS